MILRYPCGLRTFFVLEKDVETCIIESATSHCGGGTFFLKGVMNKMRLLRLEGTMDV